MSKKAMTLVIAFATLAVMTASAETVDLMSTSLGKIDAAYTRGEIDYDHAVTYKYLAITTGASRYVPANLLGERYAPGMTSGTPAVIEIREAWPYLSADCKAMVADFHDWGPGETFGHTTWRPTPWGNTSYGGTQTKTFTDSANNSQFLTHWAVSGMQMPPSVDYDSPDNPYNGGADPVPDMAYFSDVYYNVGLNTFTDHGWYDFSETDYEDWFPLRDYYADYDLETEGDQPFPGGDYDYGGDDFWDVYIGELGTGIGGVTYPDNAFPLTPWYVYSSYCCQPRGDYTETWDWDNPFNLPEAAVHEFHHATQNMYDTLGGSPTAIGNWYKEATSMWSEMLAWPSPNMHGYIRDVIVRWDSYKGASTRTLGSSPDNGYVESIINFFFEDWSTRDWTAPDWTPPPADPGFTGEAFAINNNIVREMWRASTGPGDPFFDEDETLNRNTYEAFDYVISQHNNTAKYRTDMLWPAWTDAYYTFGAWNWFWGSQGDGRYRYEDYSDGLPANVDNFSSGEYPVVDESGNRNFDFFGHGYIRFDDLSSDPVVAGWADGVFGFSGDPEADDATKSWRGGIYVSSDSGSTWGTTSGTAGVIEGTFDANDFSIVQVNNPSQYDRLAYLMVNVAEEGEGTDTSIFCREVTEKVAPVTNVSIIRPEINPDYLEVLVGTNEDLFGVPRVIYDIDYNDIDDVYGEVSMSGNDTHNSFVGTYVIPVGANGTGILDYGAADLNGNVTEGQLSLSLGLVTGAGGVVGSDPAFIRVPSGAFGAPLHVSIVPLEGFTGTETATPELSSLSTNIAKRNTENEVFGTAYDFGPVWADLNEDVYITLNYAGLNVEREEYLSVYRYSGGEWVDLGGVIDKSHNRVIAESDSLGVFALGYGEKKGLIGNPNAPVAFALYQNYPNPATDISIVKYALPKPVHASIKIYDIKGRVVDVIVDEDKVAGEYSVTIDTGSLSNGVYLYRMETDDFSAVKKMVIAH